jgi:hypothetical protein
VIAEWLGDFGTNPELSPIEAWDWMVSNRRI